MSTITSSEAAKAGAPEYRRDSKKRKIRRFRRAFRRAISSTTTQPNMTPIKPGYVTSRPVSREAFIDFHYVLISTKKETYESYLQSGASNEARHVGTYRETNCPARVRASQNPGRGLWNLSPLRNAPETKGAFRRAAFFHGTDRLPLSQIGVQLTDSPYIVRPR